MERKRLSRSGALKTHYHKGTQFSGGGGHKGAGGKKGRPALGWEKGDMVRNVDDSQTPFQVPAKPGRRKTLYEPTKEDREQARLRKIAARVSSRNMRYSITVRAPEFNFSARLRRRFADRLRLLLDRYEKVTSAVVTFELLPDGARPDYEVLCTVRVRLFKLPSTTIECGGRDSDECFDEALKVLPAEIQSSYATMARRVRRRQGESVTRRFHRARIVGHI